MVSFSPLLLLAAASLMVISNTVSAEDVYYEWTIQPRLSVPPYSPDCYTDRDLLLVNDQFPGPEIRANVGDTIHISFQNLHPSEGVTIHYHGILMLNQPYQDGTAGISTCVVGPMQSFEHSFVADNAGTHYWHGHTSLDRLDGLQGVIVIEDPDDPEEMALKELYDEERVLFLQDWYHKSGSSLRTTLDSGVWIGSPQSLLINGKGRFGDCVEDPMAPGCDEDGCSVENYVPVIDVEPDKTYLFRILNVAGFLSINLAIAEHNMTVVKADGTFVDPVQVTSLEVNTAQRYSVLVTTATEVDSFWIGISAGRFNTGYAYLSYDNSTAPNENDTMPVHGRDAGVALDAMLFSKDVSTHRNADILTGDIPADHSAVLVTSQALHPPSGTFKYTTNNVSNSLHSPVPLAALAYDAVNAEDAAPWPDTEIPGTVLIPKSPPLVWNYSNTPSSENVSSVHFNHGLAVLQLEKGQVVDLVFQNTVGNRGSADSHAWHLHGHDFYVIGQGTGTFNADTDSDTFNFVNPVLRDTFSVWDLGWTAIRFKADNVGVWPFHCTMAIHAVTGMGFTVITSPDMLSAPPPGVVSCTMTSVDPADAQMCMTPEELLNFTDWDNAIIMASRQQDSPPVEESEDGDGRLRRRNK